jgi:hypothetical protein
VLGDLIDDCAAHHDGIAARGSKMVPAWICRRLRLSGGAFRLGGIPCPVFGAQKNKMR